MSLRLLFQLKMFQHEFIDKRPIVYIDESGFSVDAPRPKGYCPKGEQCYAVKDWHARGRVNAIGAIIDFKLINVCLFETNINADVFYAWLTQELLFCIPDKILLLYLTMLPFTKEMMLLKQLRSKDTF